MKIKKSFFTKRREHMLSMSALLVVLAVAAGLLSQTVQAKTTYVIMDGDQVITHTTYTSDPDKVLTEAGLSLDTDDTYTTQATENGSQIVVRRAQSVKVLNQGRETELSGYDETVEELLSRSGIILREDCFLSVPGNTPIYDGMEVSIDHVVQRQEQYTVEIPFDITYSYDSTMKAGESKVLREGVPGQALCTANVVYENAREQERVVVEETVLEQPVEQVVALGTADKVQEQKPRIGDGKIVLPSGDVLTYYSKGQFVATAYTQTDAGCNDITATGSHVRQGVVAVDPTVVPYGTRMFIVTNDGSYIYGLGTAEDCGGAIQGNRLDLYMDTTEECFQFGVKNCTVYFLGDANWR